MKLIRGGALFIGLLGVAGATQAGVTSTWTIASDYDFRGITQTARDPAVQASLDYAHASGAYVGAWASNIDFGTNKNSPANPTVETDFYGGFKKSYDSGVGFDVGAVYYTYHLDGGKDFNYWEGYAGGSYKWASAKLFYSPKFGGNAAEDFLGKNISAFYISTDAAYPLPKNFSIIAHAGYSFGDYWDKLKDIDAGQPYFDWAVGVGVTTGYFSWAAKYIDGSDLKQSDIPKVDVFTSRSKYVLTVSTTFPWAKPE